MLCCFCSRDTWDCMHIMGITDYIEYEYRILILSFVISISNRFLRRRRRVIIVGLLKNTERTK